MSEREKTDAAIELLATSIDAGQSLVATVLGRKALDISRVRARFKRSIRDYVRGLAQGHFTVAEFTNELRLLIDRWFPQAFLSGLLVCGVDLESLEEAEPEERQMVYREMGVDLDAAARFGADIADGRYGDPRTFQGRHFNEKIWRALMNRALTYVKRLEYFYVLGQGAGCANRMMEWSLGRTEEHCDDCFYYDGQVHRMSTWQKYGALPQSRALACGGWVCDCSLSPTTSRAKGKLRRPTGG